ncbi:MAG: MFS transporter [Thermoplasmata archaeon]|nr:MFS transporter [Thermoplasmata archaeon]
MSSARSVVRAPLNSRAAVRATALLIALRVGYAYNWFDVGPGLPAIGTEFGVGVADWGLLLAAFLVGAGVFQVPAGLLARRYGSRVVSLAGTALLAVGGVAGALAPNFPTLLALRLLSGVGAGLFFSPAIGLVASLYPEGRRGVPVGTFSSAFSAGAAMGLLGSSFLVPLVGWRWALAFGGLLLAAVTLAALFGISREAGAPDREPVRPGIPAALRFRGTWAVGLAFIGVEGAAFATGQFIVPYGETVLGWAALLAGVVGMMFVLPSVVGGPAGGSLAERYQNHRTQFVVAAMVAAGVLLLLPVAGWAVAIAIGTVFSFAYGLIYAVMYVLPHYWRSVPAGEIPLAIGLFNSIQLAGGAGVSALFAWVVAQGGYAVGWWFLAGAMVVTLVALVALPPTAPDGAGRPTVAEDGAPSAEHVP